MDHKKYMTAPYRTVSERITCPACGSANDLYLITGPYERISPIITTEHNEGYTQETHDFDTYYSPAVTHDPHYTISDGRTINPIGKPVGYNGMIREIFCGICRHTWDYPLEEDDNMDNWEEIS